MAYEGELVKMNDGRWARFQRLAVTDPSGNASAILVAVELEDRFQRMLDEAAGELTPNAQVRMSMDANGSLELSQAAAQ